MAETHRTPPTCIGLILDGNRRWAKERGMPQMLGHKQGFEKAKEAVWWIKARGVKHVALFVFSTENWKRSEEEVSYLMDIFQDAVTRWFKEFSDEGMRIRFVGALDMLPENLRKSALDVEKASEKNTDFTVWVCMSYGSRAEITSAAKAAAASGEEITEESLHKHFWTAEMPDPDLIIRTSGEKRLSNFLLWQAAYSELFFIEPHWPDFSEKILDEVLAEYAERERRHGK